MTRYNIINGVSVLFTAKENAQKDADEKAWNDGAADRNLSALRLERDAKLAETDHYGLSDHTMTSAMSTYRQALRDITDNATSLDDVTWPTKP